MPAGPARTPMLNLGCCASADLGATPPNESGRGCRFAMGSCFFFANVSLVCWRNLCAGPAAHPTPLLRLEARFVRPPPSPPRQCAAKLSRPADPGQQLAHPLQLAAPTTSASNKLWGEGAPSRRRWRKARGQKRRGPKAMGREPPVCPTPSPPPCPTCPTAKDVKYFFWGPPNPPPDPAPHRQPPHRTRMLKRRHQHVCCPGG